jgi:hypothetical protein
MKRGRRLENANGNEEGYEGFYRFCSAVTGRSRILGRALVVFNDVKPKCPGETI